MRDQERIKLKSRIDEPMKTKKVASMINSVNQPNSKMKKAKSKKQ
jgi:hypothetical protein